MGYKIHLEKRWLTLWKYKDEKKPVSLDKINCIAMF